MLVQGVISLPAGFTKEQDSTREKLKLRYDMKHIENDHSIVIKEVKIQIGIMSCNYKAFSFLTVNDVAWPEIASV